jgi:sensor c-di-GMP phosphodiesterase-like protein
MSQTVKKPNHTGRTVFLVTATCGVIAGYLIGCVLALVQATNWLEHYSAGTAAQESAALAEAHSVLNAMQVSRYGTCSDTEIANFRTQVFRSEYLKDAGRIHGGKIVCSAASGRSAPVLGLYKPGFRQQDGTIAYSHLTSTQNTNLKRAALQLGSAYVVFGTEMPSAPEPIPMHLAVTLRSSPNAAAGIGTSGTEGGDASFLTTEGTGRVGSTIFATRCSDLSFSCATAYTSIPDVLHHQPDTLYSSAFAGGMAGILLGMAFSLLYKRHRQLGQQLRRALRRDGLHVLYQPIVNLETRQIVGAEALARWTDEDGNMIPPDLFIKTAEDLGFVGLITKAVLRHILRDFAETLQSRPGFRVSINVAAADLGDPEFQPMLENSLQKAGVAPQSLALEITERSAATSKAAMATIRNLRKLGHSIHIDDFGSGYSNLDRLLCLSADTIKIDKAFTRLIGTESVAAAILPQIMTMAKALKLDVVVEGVEDTQQAEYFMPCRQKIYAQGWLYGRPMTAKAFLAELADQPIAANAAQGMYSTFGNLSGLQAISSIG